MKTCMIAFALVGSTTTVTAQDMLISIFPTDNNFTSWSIFAEFVSTPPSPIVQLWADASFELTGDGSPITITNYNPAYDTTLGDARIENNGTDSVQFVGNANSFFGTPDSSNPLFVANFTYFGSFIDLQFSLVGQNSALFDFPPFGDVRLYQDAQGNQGELVAELALIPAPHTLAIAPLALLAARRRRK